MFWPVTQDPAGETSQSTAAAISTGRPRRPIGIRAAILGMSSTAVPPMVVVERVGTLPGRTELALMPRGPSSMAMVWVRLFIAAFAAP